ncbi:hypothetical protein KP509_17G066100 [Ceratopteris richardii]|uniref:J domain-containing protein n=1 Tax=Ceratopteris richardii TaxID=49495 RepID=A0A8T2SZ01_CERRI|nr:hypothetical protein KP509_17G066100 [Ceratopteris richardii]
MMTTPLTIRTFRTGKETMINASVHDVKKAYRRLVLKFHPDVCKDDHCTNKFLQISDAYETVMNFLEGDKNVEPLYRAETRTSEPMMGAFDDTWEEWEEWMGWEGAGIRDYSSHINHDL